MDKLLKRLERFKPHGEMALAVVLGVLCFVGCVFLALTLGDDR